MLQDPPVASVASAPDQDLRTLQREARKISRLVIVSEPPEFGGEHQQPRPAVGPFKPARLWPAQIGALGFDLGVGESVIEQRAHVGAFGAVWKAAQAAGQRPVAVYAGMPVEAAEEHWMQRTGAERVGVAGEHVVELVRILPRHVAERDAGEVGGDVGGEAHVRTGRRGRT